TGDADAAVLEVPTAMLPGVAGQVVVAVLAAGAFAAFVSASSGLLVSVAGTIATDLLWNKTRDFRIAVFGVAGLAATAAVVLPYDDIQLTVWLEFALAATTFCTVCV